MTNACGAAFYKVLYRDRHSGLDPESSLFNWIPAFAGMTIVIIFVCSSAGRLTFGI